MNKLHIGAGKNYLPGWTNVDIFSTNHADIYSNALALPLPRESFDIIYACHVLEHFNRHLVLTALTHWKDLLIPGGILRLSTPDFFNVSYHYHLHHDLKVLFGLLYGGQRNQFDVHNIIFDMETLTESLKTVGFKNVILWDWQKTDHANFDDYSQAYLPHMDKENGMHMSLNLEATK